MQQQKGGQEPKNGSVNETAIDSRTGRSETRGELHVAELTGQLRKCNRWRYTALEHLEEVATAKTFSVRDVGLQPVLKFKRATFPRRLLSRAGYVDAGGFSLIYEYRKGRNHSPTIKPFSSENYMREGRADRLTEEDRRRFEELFLPHLDAAYNLARWIIRHDQDAQDVVQEAYIRALKGFDLFRGGKSRGWFLKIVRNTAYTFLNRRAAQERLVPYEEEKHANIISIDDPDNELLAEGRKEYLQRALERLPLEFREVIILYELEGLSYKELASTLGIPVGTVMSRLSRARRRLQERSDFRGVEHEL